MFHVWVQYSFDERQPQCQGSAGHQGSEDTGDVEDSFSKQVATFLPLCQHPVQKTRDHQRLLLFSTCFVLLLFVIKLSPPDVNSPEQFIVSV